MPQRGFPHCDFLRSEPGNFDETQYSPLRLRCAELMDRYATAIIGGMNNTLKNLVYLLGQAALLGLIWVLVTVLSGGQHGGA